MNTPLDIDDIRATDEFRKEYERKILTPIFWDGYGVNLSLSYFDWANLAALYLRRQHGSNEWKPCTKEAK